MLLLPFHVYGSTLSTIHSVPIPRKSYEPLDQVRASFAKPIENDMLVAADLVFNVSRPTVRLANFPAILDIKCQADFMTILFTDEEHADMAYNSWENTTDLTVLTPHEAKCQGDEVGAFHVHSIELLSTVLKLKIEKLQLDQVLDTWSLSVSQYNNSQIATSQSRDLSASTGFGFKQLVEYITRPFKWEHDKTSTIPLKMNYDNSVQNPNISVFNTIQYPIPGLPKIGLFCIDCYTSGAANLRVDITGTMVKITGYNISVFGELRSSMNLQAMMGKNQAFKLYEKQLLALPLTPFQIPGILSFGPELRLKSGLVYDVDRDTEMEIGFDAVFPFDWQMSSGNHLEPSFSSSGDPKLTHHPVKTSRDVQASLAAHLTPIFAVSLTMIKFIHFDVNINFDNALGVQVTTNTCPDKNLDIRLYHEHDIKVGYNTPTAGPISAEVYHSPKYEIACLYCEKCTPQTTSKIDNSQKLVARSTLKKEMSSTQISVPTNYPPASLKDAALVKTVTAEVHALKTRSLNTLPSTRSSRRKCRI